MTKKRYRPVWISWVDSCTHPGWVGRAEIAERVPSQPIVCQTAGFLVRENRLSVTVALSMNEYGNVADPIVIPRECVRIVRYLKRGKTVAPNLKRRKKKCKP